MPKMLLLFSVWILLSCHAQPAPDTTTGKPAPTFFTQLYLLFEADDPGFCYKIAGEQDAYFGGIYFTEKGNVILDVTSDDMARDTVRCLYGQYTQTDSTITCRFTNEYVFKGQWDASLADFSKGQSRTIQPVVRTLVKSTCQDFPWLTRYEQKEKTVAAARYKGVVPLGNVYMPYQETEGMKFYIWFFKQILKE